MLELRGKSFDFEVTNPDHLERFEDAYLHMQETARRIEETRAGKRSSQYIREACLCAVAFLDHVLGEGAARDLLGGSVSLISCAEVSEELARQVSQQLADARHKFAQFSPDRLNRHRL